MNRRGQDRIGPLGGSGMVGLWGASSVIDSVQYASAVFGVSSASSTATINSVDLSRTICVGANGVNYTNDNGSLGPGYTLARIKLTDATTVTAENFTSGSTYSNAAGAFIVSFRPGVIKSIQRGTASGSSAAISITLTAVNRAKTLVLVNGVTANTYGLWNAATGAMREYGVYGYFTSDTAFQFEKSSNSYITNVNYEVVEFF